MGIFFIWEGMVSFWGTGPKHRMAYEGCSSRSEWNPVLPCHLWWEKKSYYPDIPGSFFQEDRIESSKEPEFLPSTLGMSAISACPPSLIADSPSTLPSPTSSLSSSQYLFLPVHLMPALHASCCAVLLYLSRYCIVRLKMISLFFICFYVLFVRKVL